MNTEHTLREMKDGREKMEAGGGNPLSSFQYPASAVMAPARLPARSTRRAPRAFTLIELLVVIGVIVILAAMTFPAMQGVQAAQARHRARAELTQMETAIEAYHTKLGFYPPDNAPNWVVNQLYYELLGTTKDNTGYQTLDGSSRILNSGFSAAFGVGTKITGFMNCSAAGAADDAPRAVKFLTGLRDGQFLAITNGPVTPICTLLGVSMSGAVLFSGADNRQIVPYGYNSSNPQHNPRSFDLWVDIIAGGKTNRISNWSSKPINVYYTSIANSYPP